MDWLGYLTANIAFYCSISSREQGKLCDITRILIAEKSWEGCGGLTLTDEMQVTIAAQAALLVLGFEDEYYRNVETILVYPQGFLVKTQRRGVGGMIVEQVIPYAGEAALQGPVVVSWRMRGRAGGQPAMGATWFCMSSRTNWTCGTARRMVRPICKIKRRSKRGHG